jgi:hypothetical protein
MIRRILLATATALTAAVAGPAHAVPLIGLVGQATLIAFDSASPTTVTRTLMLTGIASGDVLRGIDTRPATGQLYALGQSGQIYTVDTLSGVATTVGTPIALSQIDYDLSFNPTSGLLRVIGGTNLNLSVDPDTAVVTVQTDLAFKAGDRNFGIDPTATGAAYTNQNRGPQTSTVLYDIDAATNSLVIQTPAAGLLTTVGPLGVTLFNFGDIGVGVGFDIDGASGRAFASLITLVGANGLYEINLGTGAATLLADFGVNSVRDIAVGSLTDGGGGGNVVVPAPAALGLFGLAVLGLGLVRARKA